MNGEIDKKNAELAKARANLNLTESELAAKAEALKRFDTEVEKTQKVVQDLTSSLSQTAKSVAQTKEAVTKAGGNLTLSLEGSQTEIEKKTKLAVQALNNATSIAKKTRQAADALDGVAKIDVSSVTQNLAKATAAAQELQNAIEAQKKAVAEEKKEN